MRDGGILSLAPMDHICFPLLTASNYRRVIDPTILDRKSGKPDERQARTTCAVSAQFYSQLNLYIRVRYEVGSK